MVWKHPQNLGAYPHAFHIALGRLAEAASAGHPLRTQLQTRENRDLGLVSREFHAFVKVVRGLPGHQWHAFATGHGFRVIMSYWPLTKQTLPTVTATRRAELPAGIADMLE